MNIIAFVVFALLLLRFVDAASDIASNITEMFRDLAKIILGIILLVTVFNVAMRAPTLFGRAI